MLYVGSGTMMHSRQSDGMGLDGERQTVSFGSDDGGVVSEQPIGKPSDAFGREVRAADHSLDSRLTTHGSQLTSHNSIYDSRPRPSRASAAAPLAFLPPPCCTS